MNDAISNTFFLKLDIIDSKKSKSFSKDLFSQKLGQTALFNSSLHKNKLPSIKKNKFNNISMFPKNNSNIYLSSDNENDLSNILNKLNIPYVPQKRSFWSNENNKQPLLKNISLLNDFSFKEKYTKKELKEMMDLRQKQHPIEKKSDKKIDKDNSLNNYKEKEKEKESSYSKNKENSNKKNKIKIIDAISHVNIQKNLVKKENSKEILGYEPKAIKPVNIKNNKYRNKSQEKISISAIKIKSNNDKLDKESILFLKNFYEDFIEVYNLYDNEKYISTINNFNQTYFFLFDLKSFPKSPMNNKFLNSFKYSSILIICLVFLAKDVNLYKATLLKIKENLEIFILLCLNFINYKVLESQKILNFVENCKIKIEEKSLIDILNNIVSILFDDKMNDYKKLRKCLKQMANNINEDSPEKILNIVNDTILFCHNCSYYIEETECKKKKKTKNKNIKEEKKDINNNEDNLSITIVQEPFIKNKMNKKFCLVIDLDETLIHNLNLPFGDYFFVRPGVFDFLEKIHEIFEIIVFTAGQKNYAYTIIDKIDYKNYISYILYKKHLIYEGGIAIKKLDLIGRDLNKIVFVDNLENNAKYNKKNLYLISSWYNNIYDDQISKLKEKLINIATSGKYDDDITKGLVQN